MSLYYCWLYRMKIIASQLRQMLYHIVLPLLAVIIMGQFLTVQFSQLSLPIAVVDHDQSKYSQAVIERIQNKPALSIYVSNKEEALHLLNTNKVEAIYIFKETFMENILAGRYEQIIHVMTTPHSLGSGVAGEMISAEVIRLSSNALAGDEVVRRYLELGSLESTSTEEIQQLWEEAWAYTDAQWEPTPLMSITYEKFGEEINDVRAKPIDTGVHSERFIRLCGVVSFFIMLLSLLSSQWIVEERRSQLFTRVRSSSISLFTYMWGSSLAYLSIMIIQLLLVFILSSYVYSIDLPISLELIMIFIMYTIACLSIGVLLGTLVNSVTQLQVFALLITLASSLVGGSFVHLADVSNQFGFLTRFTPQGWLLHGVRDSLAYVEFNFILTGISVLLGIVCICTILSYLRVGGRS